MAVPAAKDFWPIPACHVALKGEEQTNPPNLNKDQNENYIDRIKESWPGVGKWLVESINRRDYPALQGGVLLIACLVMSVNLLVDLLYGVLNPRIRRR